MNLNKLGILSIHPTEFHYNYFLLIKSENISIIFHNFLILQIGQTTLVR